MFQYYMLKKKNDGNITMTPEWHPVCNSEGMNSSQVTTATAQDGKAYIWDTLASLL